MIPKTIHYCWFGGAEPPKLVLDCIESWRVACPDYEIKRWDESNCDVYKNLYVSQAVKAKKWAYVADYFRAEILFALGGIYLDTDLKLLKSLDPFLNDGYFLGFEEQDFLESYVLGCEQGHPFAKAVLDTFTDKAFIKEDGSYDYYTMPMRLRDAFIRFYGCDRFYSRKIVYDGITVYPREVFSPVDFLTKKCKVTKRTVAMHLYNGSWLDNGKGFGEKPKGVMKIRLRRLIKGAMYRVLGYKKTRAWLDKKGE